VIKKTKPHKSTNDKTATVIDWKKDVDLDGKVFSGRSDGLDANNVPSIEVLASTQAPVKIDPRLNYGRVKERIEKQWPNLILAANNGYEFASMAKAIGISLRAMQIYLQRNPERKRELIQGRLKIRDVAIGVILNAANKGNWIPAAWLLERLYWQEFAKPEVRLQLLDRVTNLTEVSQTFGGKSLQEIGNELREVHGENPNYKRRIEQSQVCASENGAKLDHGRIQNGQEEGEPN